MHKTPPFAINADAKLSDSTGYKASVFLEHASLSQTLHFSQAVWDKDACEASMTTNGIYEGAGLVLWLATGALGSLDSLSGCEDVCWCSLVKFEESLFSKKVAFRTTVTRDKKKQKTARDRIVWPCEMIVVADSVKAVLCDHFDGALRLSGQTFIVWAWYLAVFKALVSQDCVCISACC